MKEHVSFKAFYPHPPERVWKALTDPNALGAWMMPTDFEPRIGFRFAFQGLERGGNSTVRGEVLDVQPGKLLRYSWDDGEEGSPSVVSWSLSPKDGGTEVQMEHVAAVEAEPYVLIEASLNWRYAMYASLPVLLGLMRSGAFQRPPTPIVYVPEEAPNEAAEKRRAGFRQEEATCR